MDTFKCTPLEISGTSYEMQLLSPSQLLQHPQLQSICSVINDAYITHFQSLVPASGATRVKHPSELVSELHPSGACCVIFALQSTGRDVESYSESFPVAFAAIKPYQVEFEHFAIGERVTTDTETELKPERHEDGAQLDWELTAVAVHQDKSYAKKGLVTRCIVELERYVCSAVSSSFGGKSTKGVDNVGRTSEVVIWVRTIQEMNGTYWARKGYKASAVYHCSKGVLGAFDDFHLITLVKRLAI
ncbi:hypothetical protein BDV25DRAFT_143526 [Aspergillus avenaceus]|uniref:N-acetyltransferase domain-containing protein n=1 Tax=Aspergillus avenaceus TaxID=36643 RepID=A0A5N6TKF7_ASPAV|nr:hypothetical protein BDV25DRAFT_143526 [Aspergillus avenaceus]